VVAQRRSKHADRLWLYLPEDWAADIKRRWKTGVPVEVISRTATTLKELVALGKLRWRIERNYQDLE